MSILYAHKRKKKAYSHKLERTVKKRKIKTKKDEINGEKEGNT